MLCVVWLDTKYCRWNCNSNTWTNTLNSVLHREYHKTSFIHCFIVTAKNLIWPVVFLFFCSWWPAEEYLFEALSNSGRQILENLIFSPKSWRIRIKILSIRNFPPESFQADLFIFLSNLTSQEMPQIILSQKISQTLVLLFI